jgi:hypothetical protein
MVYVVFSVYFFSFFIGRRREYENLVFSLFSLDVSLYFFLRTQIKHHLGLDFFYCKKIEYIALSLVFILFLDFVTLYFRKKRNFVHYTGYGINVLCILFFLLTADYSLWSKVNHYVMQPTWILMVPLALYILVSNLKKDRDARYMLGGFALLILCSLNDILADRGISPLPRLSSYGFLAFIGGLGIILNQRFIRLHHDVEDLNRNLEQKVQQRTEELQQTLEEVQALKVQQDGDYFLTSLLMRPLGRVTVESDAVAVRQFVRQKKTFVFKGREYDIGGDLNIVHNVRLLGREYIAFLNSDAMGKSIQGAGGALITGVIVNSYLHRPKVSSAYSGKHPERWLKDCYQDLQAVFETFDGSMLTSLVFGLLDVEQGLLYHINAEHPWGVLYRRGQAMFIEHEQFLRKIGIQLHIAEKDFRIQTLLLEPGDMLVFGSDGRDDVVIGEDAVNGRIINEDETSFCAWSRKPAPTLTNWLPVLPLPAKSPTI